MRTTLVLSILLCAAVALQTTTTRPATAQEKQAPVKWEYGTITIPIAVRTGTPGGYAWTTGREYVAGDNWKDLAEKLKVELKDKDAPTAKIRVQVLNHLGAQGWELVSHSETNPSFTFKRRVP